uniref:Uncharacterized protein n=1 Tax=Trichobilharzia regenti TaxID=157069 RepID=A0AA85J9F2_TRIRE|nr:unnamed protein product [Trichobilharzia regenti]
MSTNRPLQVVNSSERSTDLSGIFGELILGRRFLSWDEFQKSLAEFQKLSCTHYVHTYSKTIPDDRFKYAFVGFKCTFGVNRTKPGLKLKYKSSKCCNCSSSFRVVLRSSEFIIASHNMVHNHLCSRVYMQNDRHLLLVHFRKPYFTVNHVMQNCKQWAWSRDLFASQCTSAVVLRNRSAAFESYISIVNKGLRKIHDEFGEVFARNYVVEVVAGINRTLNM